MEGDLAEIHQSLGRFNGQVQVGVLPEGKHVGEDVNVLWPVDLGQDEIVDGPR